MKDLQTFRPKLRSLLTALVCASTAVLAPACSKDDAESQGFFDEQGVWLLTAVNLNPAEEDSKAPAAKDGFMMQFGKTKKGELVVATAACGVKSDKGKNPHHVLLSECGNEALEDEREWQCGCYSYTFDDKTMTWSELEEDKPKKKKKKKKNDDDDYADDLRADEDDDDDGKKTKKKKKKKKGDDDEKGDDDKEKDEGGKSKLTSTTIKAHKSKKATYVFVGMPNFDNKDEEEDNVEGVFQSNGMTSQHTFAKRTYSSFAKTKCAKKCGLVEMKDEKEKDDEDEKTKKTKKKKKKKKKSDKDED